MKAQCENKKFALFKKWNPSQVKPEKGVILDRLKIMFPGKTTL